MGWAPAFTSEAHMKISSRKNSRFQKTRKPKHFEALLKHNPQGCLLGLHTRCFLQLLWTAFLRCPQPKWPLLKLLDGLMRRISPVGLPENPAVYPVQAPCSRRNPSQRVCLMTVPCTISSSLSKESLPKEFWRHAIKFMQLRRNKGSGKAGDSLAEEKKQWPVLSEIKTCDLPHLYLPNLSSCPIASELRFLVYSIEPIISALGHVSIEVKNKLLQFSSSKHPCGTSNVLGIELALKSQAWE